MTSLRVGLVCGYFDPTHDGVADYTRHLQHALYRLDVEALICTSHENANGSRDDVVGVTRRWDIHGIFAAARNLRALQLDVVHVQFAPSAFRFSRAVGLLPALINSGTPLVATLHEYDVWAARGALSRTRSAAWRVVERRGYGDRETLLLVPRADRVLVVSEEHVHVVLHRFGKHATTPTVVPVGPNILMGSSDREHARRITREALAMPAEAPLVLFFGFFHPVKALDQLIEAVALVGPLFPGLRLVLAGGEESHSVMGQAAVKYRARLEDVARRLHVHASVTFTGYLPEEDVSRLLLAADVAVFPFDAGVTGKSGSLLAARTHGVPIIATAPPGTLSGPREVAGILRIPPRNTAAIAEALKLVLGDPDVAARLRAATQTYPTPASWDAIAAVHVDIYTDVMRGRRGRLR
jgi:glycosyltransferase involved in cell wall biosynthesis